MVRPSASLFHHVLREDGPVQTMVRLTSTPSRLSRLLSPTFPLHGFRLFVSVAILLLLTSPLSADEYQRPDPGRAYKVVGVSASDQLNVRNQPASSAPIIGSVRFDATAITVTGISQTAGHETWWQIAQPVDQKIGWVNARFLALADDRAEPITDFALRCTGTEPFWSLEIEKGHARFETPEGNGTSWTASGWRLAAGQRPGHRFAIQLGTENAQPMGWAAVWRPQRFCTDGMSDLEFPYGVILSTPTGRDLAGCCARAR
jgi:uncharacterized membrane protein